VVLFQDHLESLGAPVWEEFVVVIGGRIRRFFEVFLGLFELSPPVEFSLGEILMLILG
jgi:hypothetical protein